MIRKRKNKNERDFPTTPTVRSKCSFLPWTSNSKFQNGLELPFTNPVKDLLPLGFLLYIFGCLLFPWPRRTEAHIFSQFWYP